MSIVTQSPHVSTQSVVFISGRSKAHGMVTYIDKWGGKGRREKAWAGKGCGQDYRWLCGHVYKPTR